MKFFPDSAEVEGKITSSLLPAGIFIAAKAVNKQRTEILNVRAVYLDLQVSKRESVEEKLKQKFLQQIHENEDQVPGGGYSQ